jgi:long-subunit acyl-CoA synthetase (AMP-forming)
LLLAKSDLVKKYDLSSLKIIVSAAAPLSEALTLETEKKLSVKIKQAYGMTELGPVTHICPDDPTRIKAGSAGLLVPNTECMVIDPQTGKEKTKPKEEGEIWIRGPQVMQRYFNNPKATQNTITEDGWLKTGDIGYIDEGGYLFIVDRLKELIKHKGFQVAPAELGNIVCFSYFCRGGRAPTSRC